MLRVTHITRGYPSAAVPHEATFFCNQMEGLLNTGYVLPNVLAPITWVPKFISRLSPGWERRWRIPWTYEHNGIHVYRPRYLRLPIPQSWCRDLVFLSGVIRRNLFSLRPDIVHVHTATGFGLAALLAARSMGLRPFLTLHGSDTFVTPFQGKRYLSVFIKAMRTAETCFAVSQELADKARSLSGVTPTVLPLGINLKRFGERLSKASSRERFKVPQNARVVLFIGRLVEAKGVEVLLQALNRCPSDVIGVFAGEGPMAGAIQQHPRAKWVGAVSNALIPHLVSGADVFVLPSHNEGLGIVLLEAGALGVPVVGTAVGGIVSLLGDNRGYLTPVNDPITLSENILRALAGDSETIQKAAEFRAFIQKNHDADANAAQLARMYKQVLGQSINRFDTDPPSQDPLGDLTKSSREGENSGSSTPDASLRRHIIPSLR